MVRTPIYFLDGRLIAESGDARVYKFEGDLYLEGGQGHYLWAISNEIGVYEEQLSGLPKGNCLEIGLGLGICSTYILSWGGVEALTTIELNPGVINVFRKLNPIVDERHKIICGDGLEYMLQTEQKFDFIFLDFYALIDEEVMEELKSYVSVGRRILNEKGIITAWLDEHTPEEFITQFNELFG